MFLLNNNKRFFFLVGFLFAFFIKINAQTELKIGANAGSISSSAAFEVESTSKGILLPRMTTMQMNGISSPVTGLMIFNTDLNCIHYYFSGWKSQCDPANLGAWSLLGNTGTNATTNFLGTADNTPLRFRTNNTNRMSLNEKGHLVVGNWTNNADAAFGIYGAASPSYSVLSVADSVTDFSNTTAGFNAFLKLKPAANTTNTNYGGLTGIHIPASNTFNINSLIGFGADSRNYGSGNVTSNRALYAIATNQGTGNTTDMYGLHVYADNRGTGTSTNIYGVHTGVNLSAGTITNGYGLYVNDVAGTNNWGIYQKNILNKNYFAGNIGIGIALPTYKLDIQGTNPLRLNGLVNGATTDSVLTSASGVVRRLSASQLVGANAWSLLGNTGTNAATNFVGTTDNVGLAFRTNNVIRQYIDPTTGGISTGNYLTNNQEVYLGNGVDIKARQGFRQYDNFNTARDYNDGTNALENIGTSSSIIIDVPGGSTHTYSKGSVSSVIVPSTSNASIASIVGSNSRVYSNGIGNIGYVYGAINTIRSTNTGVSTALSGTSINIVSAGTGSMGAVYGANINIGNSNTGIITNSFGSLIRVKNTGAGSITNSYGLYVDEIDGTNNWGVYQLSALNKNYFAGSVGITNTTPLALLDFGNVINNKKIYLHSSATDPYGFGIASNELRIFSGSMDPKNGATFGSFDGTTFTPTVKIENRGFVGIGTITPAYKLDISAATNPVRMTGLQAGAATDDVITADATGVFRKQTAASLIANNAWSLLGNTGTNPATNYIGTTDAQDVVMKTGNVEALRLKNSDNSVDIAGHLAVGPGAATTATEVFSIYKASTSNSTAITGKSLYLDYTPTATNSVTNYGDVTNVRTYNPVGVNLNGYSIGGSFSTSHYGTGLVNLPIGLGGSVNNGSTGSMNQARATTGRVTNLSTGAISSAQGGEFSIFQVGAGTMTNASSVASSFFADNGTVTNYTSFYANTPTITAPAVVNNVYGVYLKNQAGGATSNYAIYSEGGQSYHAGNFGIGTAAPANKLDIQGTNPLKLNGLVNGATTDSVLTSASGVVRRLSASQLVAANAWGLTGNASTNPATNFAGTTDAQPFILKSNNIEGLRVATNGYVGINTTSPTGFLHATSSSAANSVLFERTHTLAATASVNLRLLGNYPAGTNPANTCGTGISFRMKDNVTPETPEAAIRLLHGTAVGKGHLQFITSDDVNGSGNVRMHIDEGGKVGIGVTNPGKILTIRDNDPAFAPTTVQLLTGYPANPVATTLINSLEFSEITTGTAGMSVDHYDGLTALSGGASGNRLDISAINGGARSTVATFTNNGNVGVGTAAPTNKLDIQGTNPLRLNGLVNGATTDSVLTSAGGVVRRLSAAELTQANAWGLLGNTGTNISTNFIGTTDVIDFVTRTNNLERMRVTSNGNVGIGNNSPNYKLDVAGSVRIVTSSGGYLRTWGETDIEYDGGADGLMSFRNTSSGGSTRFLGEGTEIMRLLNNGNVGIGTATPNTKLDVDGAIALRPTANTVTADNQAITVGNRSFLRLTPDAIPASRTITLSNGLQDGQQLVIRVSATGANGIELSDSGNLNLTGSAMLDDGDTITLIWDGTLWFEMYRSHN